MYSPITSNSNNKFFLAGNADELCGGELPTPQTKNDAYEMWSKICLLIIFFKLYAYL